MCKGRTFLGHSKKRLHGEKHAYQGKTEIQGTKHMTSSTSSQTSPNIQVAISCLFTVEHRECVCAKFYINLSPKKQKPDKTVHQFLEIASKDPPCV